MIKRFTWNEKKKPIFSFYYICHRLMNPILATTPKAYTYYMKIKAFACHHTLVRFVCEIKVQSHVLPTLCPSHKPYLLSF